MWKTAELPAGIKARADHYRPQLVAALAEAELPTIEQLQADYKGLPRALDHVLGCSEFVAKACRAWPHLWVELIQSGQLLSPLALERLEAMRQQL
ncbi:MAG TPA: hypothetical protein VIC08_07305, partial [Cellvibrionaceae bacterium]